VGVHDGELVGTKVGRVLGFADGEVGAALGRTEGAVGAKLGFFVGAVGAILGIAVGIELGVADPIGPPVQLHTTNPSLVCVHVVDTESSGNETPEHFAESPKYVTVGELS